jgi:hypothetical protein
MFSLSGCEDDVTDEKIHNTVLGKWTLVAESNECAQLSYREYLDNGTYNEYDHCDMILRENLGSWRIDSSYLVVKAKVFPIDVYYSFLYLSNSFMIVKQGNISSSNEELKYRRYTR